MTPGARVAAAMLVLDRWLAGAPVEQALTNWGRANRFAGSGDRQAVRDLVFAAVRCRRSFAALGGAETGRGLMLGQVRAKGQAPDAVFDGQGYGPQPLSDAERAAGRTPAELSETEALDCPEWQAPALRAALGQEFAPVMRLLQERAPVFLRVNLARITREAAQVRLAGEGVLCRPHPLAASALEVTEGARKVAASESYTQGLVELQDAASQAVVEALPLTDGLRVLDYCAGGGGKTLAMAARARMELYAHDVNPARLGDLAARASRAGVAVRTLQTEELAGSGPFDMVLTDVPCSGSGAWRRSPEGKWLLTPEKLAALCATQAAILEGAARLVGPRGHLAYVTCSLLEAENVDRILNFRASHPEFSMQVCRAFTPLEGGDGFFVAILRREN
jgi:16S rRNA (cytosine967-C5)-methyltransferase